MKTFAVLTVMVCLSAASAYAGPADRFQRGDQPPQPIGLSGFGSPLPGVVNSPTDLQTFANGQANFKEIETLPQIGPIFNSVSCAGCHSQPAIGGAGLFINEIRVRNNTAPGPVHIFAVDNMLRGGPQTQGTTPIFGAGMAAEPLASKSRCRMPVVGMPTRRGRTYDLQRLASHLRSHQCFIRRRRELRRWTSRDADFRLRPGRGGLESDAHTTRTQRALRSGGNRQTNQRTGTASRRTVRMER